MYKKNIISVILCFLAVAAAIVLVKTLSNEDDWICQNGQWVKHGNPVAPQPTEQCGNIELANPASVNCVEKGGTLDIKETGNGQIGICSFLDGTKCEEWAYFRDECKLGNNIIVYIPNKNQEITSSIELTGEARTWYFEGFFPVRLLDDKENILTSGYVTAQGEWMTSDFVPFKGELELQSFPKVATGGILVFQKDNPSGLKEFDEEYRMPVSLVPIETIKVKAFYNNSELDPEVSCNKVFAVERDIPKTSTVGRAALKELLKEPTSSEKDNGFFTSINSGVKILKLTIEDGIAKVDFDEQLEYQIGGSCRVSAIRAQITQTLKQFSTVNEVIISINGRTEDILQP